MLVYVIGETEVFGWSVLVHETELLGCLGLDGHDLHGLCIPLFSSVLAVFEGDGASSLDL